MVTLQVGNTPARATNWHRHTEMSGKYLPDPVLTSAPKPRGREGCEQESAKIRFQATAAKNLQ